MAMCQLLTLADPLEGLWAKLADIIGALNSTTKLVGLGLILITVIVVTVWRKIAAKLQGVAITLAFLSVLIIGGLLGLVLVVNWKGEAQADPILEKASKLAGGANLAEPLRVVSLGEPKTENAAAAPVQEEAPKVRELADSTAFYARAGVKPYSKIAAEVGRLAYYSGDTDTAESLLSQARELDSSPALLSDLAVVALRRAQMASNLERDQELDRAEKLLSQAVAKQPDLVQALTNQGFLAFERSKVAGDRKEWEASERYLVEARVHLEAALAKDPDYVPALNDLGLVLRQLARNEPDPAKTELLERARKYLLKAIALEPHSPEINFNLALLEDIDYGRSEDSAVHYQKAIDLGLQRTTAFNNLAWILIKNERLRNPQKALDLARQAVELAPADANILDTLALAAAAAGDCPTAEGAVSRMRELTRPNGKDGATGYEETFEVVAATCSGQH